MKDMETFLGYDIEMKFIFMKWYASRIADEFLVYKKYYDVSKEKYIYMVNGALDETVLTEEEQLQVIQDSKDILKNKYKIEILSDDPIVFKHLEVEE